MKKLQRHRYCQALMKARRGEYVLLDARIESSTAALQATCVDATLIPFVKKQFNMSFGCYGCRDATDIGTNETVLGFPFSEFEEIAATIAFLQEKAIPNSRGKNALALLKQKDSERIETTDPFRS